MRHVQMHVPDDGAAGEASAGPASRVRHQALQIERIRTHAQVLANEWPLDARSIAIDLDAVAVRIGEVNRLADSVVRGALQDRAGLHEPAQRPSQIGARWRQYREMVQAGRASCSGRVATLTQNEQIRAAGAEPANALITSVHDESKSGLVEPDRSFEIRDRQLDGADVRRGIDGEFGHLVMTRCPAYRDEVGCSARSRSTVDVTSAFACVWNSPLALPGNPAWTLRTLPSRPRMNDVGKELRFTPCGILSASSRGSPGTSTVYSMPYFLMNARTRAGFFICSASSNDSSTTSSPWPRYLR